MTGPKCAKRTMTRARRDTAHTMTEESTTPDLEEALRGSLGAVDRRDFDAAMALYAPNAVWDARGVGVYEGPEAIRGFFEAWQGSYEVFEPVLEEFRDLNGVTLFVVRMRGRLPGSSGLVEQRFGAVGAWSHGLLERVTTYSDIDEARAAAERLGEERG